MSFNKSLNIKLICPFHATLLPTMLPYGIGVLSSFLLKNNYKVSLDDLSTGIDFHKLKKYINKNPVGIHKYLSGSSSNKTIDKFMEEVMRYIDFYDYDLIGLSIFSCYHLYPALLIAKWIKKVNKNAFIVFGGPYATLSWDLFFSKFNFVDYVIQGDGEIPLLRLINYLEGKISITEIPGLIYRSGERMRFNKMDLFKIESESMPDFTGFHLESYKIQLGEHKSIILPYRMGKGCINRCNFCVHEKELEIKSLNKVISELRELSSKYNAKFVYFCDSLLNFSYSYMEKFCDALAHSDFCIKWGANATVNNIDKSLLIRMKKAGCSFLQFGIESGSNKMLKNMGKRHTFEEASLILKSSFNAGIKNVVYFIAGYPHETMNDAGLTVKFIADNAKYIYTGHVFKFILMSGSPIYENPEMFGICNIRPNSNYILVNSCSFDEIEGLGWKRKKREMELSYKIILKTFYYRVLLNRYWYKFIPFTLYLVIVNLVYIKCYFYSFYRLIRHIRCLLSNEVTYLYSNVDNAFTFLYLDSFCATDKKIKGEITPKFLDFYQWFLRTKYCEGIYTGFKFLISITMAYLFKYRKINVMSLNLNNSIHQDIKLEIPIEIRKAEIDDYKNLKKICGPMVLKKRLEYDDVCIIAVHNGVIVSNGWFTSSDDYIFELEKEIKLKKGELYAFGLYTHPLYRRLGFGTAIACRRILEAKKMGYEKMILAVRCGNISAQHLHERLGFELLERVSFLKIFGFKRYWVKVIKKDYNKSKRRI